VTRLVALFRGINVGGHNVVPMAGLRATFEALGLADVSSIIQSGNVCFDSDDSPDSIRRAVRDAVADRFDVDVPVLLRSADAIDAALRSMPWTIDEVEPKLHHIMFLADPAPVDAHERLGDHTPGADYRVGATEIHVRYPQGSARSTFTAGLVDRRLSTVATARNLPTCEKIARELRR
jgi:uncharacterized protein (DUF1697 family)